MDNFKRVQQAANLLHKGLVPYVSIQLVKTYGNDWWDVVLETIGEQAYDLPKTGTPEELAKSLDFLNCLRLIDRLWNDVFRKCLTKSHRSWVKELMGVRNDLAHTGYDDWKQENAWRALDTMARMGGGLKPEIADELNALLREQMYGSAAGASNAAPQTAPQASKTQMPRSVAAENLPAWRTVIEPHPDVAMGRYRNAEFAADLAQVARGEGSVEYRDPVEFFARTYVTEGMKGLLVQGLKRLCGKDGDPVIQLKTAFGGGKTHSMLALYHLMHGRMNIDRVPSIKPVMEAAGVSELPEAHVAVLVGTALDPTATKRPAKLPGVTVRTLWGEMAAQLAESAEKPELYDYVKESDKKGVSPGSVALQRMFDACDKPCLILMDELVAYARKLYERTDLPAGTFANFISFIQELTEAARAGKNSLVVASIPESDIELGGEGGRKALEAIEHTFGRMEAIWKPVAAHEGFEVVRRRLFLDCRNPEERERVCHAFSEMYATGAGDFPVEAREVEYRERMISCYPIHPEVFDRLYEDWATLERFQRTRGVLRLMAAVIHELWMNNDAGAMIMPGSIGMDASTVRDELTRHLDPGWNAIVDKEVDGKNSVPWQKEVANPRFGKQMAMRRVARSIMLGSAPTVGGQNVRGIEATRIRLGVVQPGENVAVFNDALSTLKSSLAYLYYTTSGDRFWYDTRPTLRKTMEDRASQVDSMAVEQEVEKRLKKLRREDPFGGVHVCPASSLDVTDEQCARLVLLRMADDYSSVSSEEKNPAIQAAKDILDTRGTSPRVYKNMLAFIAPDREAAKDLKQAVRQLIAWRSIKEDKDSLNLDIAQQKETDRSIARSEETVGQRLKETWKWLLTPRIDLEADAKTLLWDKSQLGGGEDSIITRAAKQMKSNEQVITEWAPALLKMELDQLLWRDKDDLSVKQLWDYLCTYCYLPRLANKDVLENAIRTGVQSGDHFAIASGIENGKYLGLKYKQTVMLGPADMLVKLMPALKQLTEQKQGLNTGQGETYKPDDDSAAPSGREGKKESDDGHGSGTEEKKTPKTFQMRTHLDTTRIGRDVQNITTEIISILTGINGAKVNIILEVDAEIPAGLSPESIRALVENCRTLKVDEFRVE